LFNIILNNFSANPLRIMIVGSQKQLFLEMFHLYVPVPLVKERISPVQMNHIWHFVS